MDSILEGILKGFVISLLVVLAIYGVAGVWLDYRQRRRK